MHSLCSFAAGVDLSSVGLTPTVSPNLDGDSRSGSTDPTLDLAPLFWSLLLLLLESCSDVSLTSGMVQIPPSATLTHLKKILLKVVHMRQ